MQKFLLIFLFLCANIVFAQNKDAYPFEENMDAKRFAAITQEIRCLVCQNQSISDSNAPLANDLRGKIYRMVLEKKTDAEIKDYLTKRYGEFILLEPRFNKVTFALWLFPFLAIGLACLFLRQLLYARKTG